MFVSAVVFATSCSLTASVCAVLGAAGGLAETLFVPPPLSCLNLARSRELDKS